jgi:aspartate kinase
MLLSTGERISCALCAMAINDLGQRAISLTGSQAGIVTDTVHTMARILDVRADRIREALADANINVDMIIQNEPKTEGAEADMSFTVPRSDLRSARAVIEPVAAEVGIADVADDPEMGKVSVVGAGMKSHPGVAARVFQTLGDQGINIEMISTSPIKISCVVAADAVDRAVRALHEAFELGADQIEAEHPFGAPA